jgi:hypothetical protein
VPFQNIDIISICGTTKVVPFQNIDIIRGSLELQHDQYR